MEYECSLVPINKVLTDAFGVVHPLCNSCLSKDCTNPIEKKSVSVMGVNKTYRLYRVALSYMCVVSCQGYSPSIPEYDVEKDDDGEK